MRCSSLSTLIHIRYDPACFLIHLVLASIENLHLLAKLVHLPIEAG